MTGAPPSQIIPPPHLPAQERELFYQLMDPAVANRPLQWIRLAYPWGKPGTFLWEHKEPRKWQCEEWERLGDWCQNQIAKVARGGKPGIYKRAFCSGHGTGKGVFWVVTKHWFKSTRLGASILDTANTEEQLRTRVWAESEKWFDTARNKHWFKFDLEQLECKPADWFAQECKLAGIPTGHYFDKAQMYKAGKPDSFAGLHNPLGIMFGVDEASGVPDFIAKTAKGFFFREMLWRIWFLFSQGRHLEGFFWEAFQDGSDWETRHLNSLEVEGTDKEFLEGIVRTQGKDSYDARVLVFGLFPNQTEEQFIGSKLVHDAMVREWSPEHEAGAQFDPWIMTVDPSGGGPDPLAVGWRRGLDFRSRPIQLKYNLKILDQVKFVVEEFNAYDDKPAVIVVDSTGLGAAFLELLKKALDHAVLIVGVNFGSGAEDNETWKDRRTELYSMVREWLDIGFIPNDEELRKDLTTPTKEELDSGLEKLTSKRKLRALLGGRSTDKGDLLAMSFHVPLAKIDPNRRKRRRNRRCKNSDYDFFGRDREAA